MWRKSLNGIELFVGDQQLNAMLAPYNPCWGGEEAIAAWAQTLPDYRRPAVAEAIADLHDLPQVVSLAGPRRVGKTRTLAHAEDREV